MSAATAFGRAGGSAVRGLPRPHRTQIHVELGEPAAGQPSCGNGRPHPAGAHQGVAPGRVEVAIPFVELAHIDVLRRTRRAPDFPEDRKPPVRYKEPSPGGR